VSLLESRSVSRSPDLPDGVRLHELTSYPDNRGTFTEVFRTEWDSGISPVQWNVVSSAAKVLRGVHVHLVHADYFILLKGRASIGLCDLRAGSATRGRAALVEMNGDALTALMIPPGVAHGFYYHDPSLHLYAQSHVHDPSEALGCQWNDPDLGIPWQVTDVVRSPRDASAPSLATLLGQMATHPNATTAAAGLL
jgi:dTDP-4-dehydrorhamnose 3,5-epimerase